MIITETQSRAAWRFTMAVTGAQSVMTASTTGTLGSPAGTQLSSGSRGGGGGVRGPSPPGL